MKHNVQTIRNNKAIKREDFATAEEAYERSVEIIDELKALKKACALDGEYLVARFNDGDLMTLEEV
jgi:hypothetical protein